MLLSDLNCLKQVLKNTSIVVADGGRYNESVDADIERMYAVSPTLQEWPVVYNFDQLYEIEAESKSFAKCPPTSSLFLSKDGSEARSGFSPLPIRTATEAPSLLTKLLEETKSNRIMGKSKSNGIPLTIYLPDMSSIQIFIKETCTFGELIGTVLVEHKAQQLQPPLYYNSHDYYEMRIHEGDGEPDRDFDAFQNDKTLKQYDLDEVCLCMKQDKLPPDPFPTSPIPQSQSQPDRSSKRFSTMFQSIDYSGKSGSTNRESRRYDFLEQSSGRSPPLYNDMEGAVSYNSSGRAGDNEFEDVIEEMLDMATLQFPNGSSVEVPYERDTTLLDLLPIIAKLHPLMKLRLHTDEYVFFISAQDQRRLQYASAKMDNKAKVSSIGTSHFELQKKTYSDSAKVANKTKVLLPPERPLTSDTDHFAFNEATANAYQEWNVVKKNRFGRKQERIFGVDGKKIYNGKRGQLKGGTAGSKVARAERDISSVVTIEILPHDKKTFRITWRDEKELYDIEYTFESIRECAEVAAKIKFIRNRDLQNAKAGGLR